MTSLDDSIDLTWISFGVRCRSWRQYHYTARDDATQFTQRNRTHVACMARVHRFNPFECKGNYSVTANNMKLVPYTGRWWVGCWYSEEETGRSRSSPSPLLAVPTAHPSTPSVLITVLLLCGFNGPIKRLTSKLRLLPNLYSINILWR